MYKLNVCYKGSIKLLLEKIIVISYEKWNNIGMYG